MTDLPLSPETETLLDEGRKLLEAYDDAMKSQKMNGDGSNACLIVMANYGDLALGLLRGLLTSGLAQREQERVLLPRRLTAENGAKAALIGEFHEDFDILDENGDEQYVKVAVTWDTIKRIWEAAVRHFEGPDTSPEGKSQ